ncbi:MAG: hypothetical protein MJ252_12785 [archaeon]|nr:hypothetical protein [archaeon]
MLLIKKLPKEIETEAQLIQNFEVYGDIILSGIIEDEVTGKMGIIVFSKREDAEKAMNSLKSDQRYEMTITPAEDEIIEKIKKSKAEIKKKKYEGCNLFVKNLPKKITDQLLFDMFSQFGKVSSARVQTEGIMKEIKDENGEVIDKEFIYESKGIGFVLFKNPEDAAKAKMNLDGMETCFGAVAMKLSIEFYDYNKGERNKIAEMKENMQIGGPYQRGKRGRFNNTGRQPHFPGNPRGMRGQGRGGRGGFKNYNDLQGPNMMNMGMNPMMQGNEMNPYPPNMNRMNQRMMGMPRDTGNIPMNPMNFPPNGLNNVPNIIPNQMQGHKITVEEYGLSEKVKAIFEIQNEEEKEEALGEVIYNFLADFIPQYKINTSGGKISDLELCSKLTGILIKTDANTIMEILSSTESIIVSLRDVIQKIMITYSKTG